MEEVSIPLSVTIAVISTAGGFIGAWYANKNKVSNNTNNVKALNLRIDKTDKDIKDLDEKFEKRTAKVFEKIDEVKDMFREYQVKQAESGQLMLTKILEAINDKK